MKKKLIIVALVIFLASVGFVAADEAGVISINLQNSNSKIIANVSNSTIQEQTNFTNSQTTENITLTNSTLTLNVNGQNITITGDENGTVAVSAPGQTVTPTPSEATLVPLNIASPPSWITVSPRGIFNDYMVTDTPDTYILEVTLNNSAYYQAFEQLYSKNMTSIFPQAFYIDFGLTQIVYPYSNNGGSQFDIAFSLNPNHITNAYLPDPPTDNSGEKYLYQAVGYYFSQYLENQPH